MEIPPNSKNLVLNSSLTAGRDIHVGDITNNHFHLHLSLEKDFWHSILFLRIEKQDDHYRALLRIKTPHPELAQQGILIEEGIRIDLPNSLFESVAAYQEFRRLDEVYRHTGRPINNRQIGSHLYQQCFQGKIGENVHALLEALQAKRIAQLMLVISADEERVRDLPWEMLLPDLALSNGGGQGLPAPNFSLVRSLEPDFGKFNMEGKQMQGAPLKMLFVTALPENLDEGGKMLGIEEEQRKLIEAVGHLEATQDSRPKLVVEFLDVASPEEIRKSLLAGGHEVLHISGHGAYQKEIQQGLLYLETEEGDLAEVEAQKFASYLKDLPKLKLVVLSACETAMAGKGGTAEAIHQAGVPAVLAMRYAVTDSCATAFTTEFYQRLAQGESLGDAVGYGRGKLWEIAQERLKENVPAHVAAEWFIPVLYLNQHIGPLLDLEKVYYLPDNFQPKASFLKTGTTRLIGQGFIGRKGPRIQLRRAVQAGWHVCITGMGGMGKTTLAEAFAYNQERKGRQLFFWRGMDIGIAPILQELVDGYKGRNPASPLNARLDALLLTDQDPKQKLSTLLSNCLGQAPSFLVFDNFEDLQWQEADADKGKVMDDDLWDFLRHLLKHTPSNCQVIFTTRYPVPDMPANVHLVQLNQLSWAEQYRLMGMSARLKHLSMGQRTDIIRRLDGHPRAYEFLESLEAKVQGFSWEEFTQQTDEKIAASKANGQAVPDAFVQAALQESAAKVFENLMLERLHAQLPEGLKQCFAMASIFIGRNPLAALAAVTGTESNALLQDLKALAEWNLCAFFDATQEFEVHALTRTWAEKKQLVSPLDRKRWAHTAACHFRDQNKVADEAKAITYFEVAEAWEDFATAALRLQGHCQIRGLFLQAIALCEAVLGKVDGKQKGQALNHLGLAYDGRGDFEKAIGCYVQSLKISQEIGDRVGEGASLNNIGQVYTTWGEYGTALHYLEQSLEISQEIGDRAGIGSTLSNIGEIHKARGSFEIALRFFEQGLKIQQEIGEREGEGAMLNNIGQIHGARGEYENALSFLEESLKIWQETRNRAGEAATLNNIATISHARGDYATALRYLEQSLKIMLEIGDQAGAGKTLNNLGNIFFVQREYNIALKYFIQSLKIRQENGDRTGEGTTLNNLATISHAQGDYDKALCYLEQSLEIQHEIGNIPGMAVTLHNIGTIAFEQGQYEAAIPYFLQAYQIYEKLGSPDVKNPDTYLIAIQGKIGEGRLTEIIRALPQGE
jgi:tetratricopeptide (TPR) repeat protein